MRNDYTHCPSCHEQSVAELDNCFQCQECGAWGYSVNHLPYQGDQGQCWNQDGQVYRKPRAA